jgi:hypothetical protein
MSTATDSPSASKIGSFGNNFWLALLAMSVIVFGANTGVATYQGSRLSGASTGASDLQVLSQQLANQGREAVAGNAEAFKAFKETKQRSNPPSPTCRPLRQRGAGVSGPLAKLSATWAPLGKSADQIVASEAAVLALAGNADRFATQVPQPAGAAERSGACHVRRRRAVLADLQRAAAGRGGRHHGPPRDRNPRRWRRRRRRRRRAGTRCGGVRPGAGRPAQRQ